MAQQGGKRPGAGRPKGARDKLTREAGATIAELARDHTEAALNALVQIATKGESEAARVTAANAILDRGYGKAMQTVEGKHTHDHKHQGQSAIENMTAEERRNMLADRLREHIAKHGSGTKELPPPSK